MRQAKARKCSPARVVARRSSSRAKCRGRVAGYLTAQAQRLGPWLCDTVRVAEALLCRALPLCPADAQVGVPECNRAATTLLERVGFSPGRRWHSMRRGGVPDL